MRILVMPGGEFGPGEQYKAGEAIDALKDKGAEHWAVQAVMPKTRRPSWFLGWRSRDRLNRIAWLTGRRVLAIQHAGSLVSGIITDYEYEPLGDLDPNRHGAAVAKVSRHVNARSLYALGLDRHSRRAVTKLVDAAKYPWLCMPQFHYRWNAGRPHDPTADIALCRELDIDPVPYVSGLMGGGGEDEVSVEQLRKQFDVLEGMHDVTTCVAWCDIREERSIGSVERVLEAAGAG